MTKDISRRSFLGGMLGVAAAGPYAFTNYGRMQKASLLPIRKRISNPYLENGKPIVVVVRGKEFDQMLKKGMEMLGGFAKLGKNKSVHLKPNFVAPSPYPVTTDGKSLVSTVELLQKEGYKDITIAEWGSLGRGGTVIPTWAFKFYGLDKKAEQGGFKIKDLAFDEVVDVKDDKWEAMPKVGVFKNSYETDVIINMPTIKQHSLLQFTCAIKNMMGCIDKQARNDMHRVGSAYDNENRSTKLKMSHLAIAELAAAVNPELTLIDARYCIGRSHHFTSGGVSRKPERLIISGDMLAADVVAANVRAEVYDGFQLEMAEPHLDHAEKLGIGARNLNEMVIKETEI